MTDQERIASLEAKLVSAWHRERALKAENDRLLAMPLNPAIPDLSEYGDDEPDDAVTHSRVAYVAAGIIVAIFVVAVAIKELVL